MIITLDGPTASGKSTLARLLADTLSAYYLNTGLTFRAVAYVLSNESTITPALINSLLKELLYTYTREQGIIITYQNKPITHLLKTPQIDQAASRLATNKDVREALLTYQRSLAHHKTTIADGRDCGTVVFPQAAYKFFITASEAVRAQRWQQDHPTYTFEEALSLIQQRDHRDSTRLLAPLKPAPDAQIIDTSNLSIDQALALLEGAIAEKSFAKN